MKANNIAHTVFSLLPFRLSFEGEIGPGNIGESKLSLSAARNGVAPIRLQIAHVIVSAIDSISALRHGQWTFC